MILWKKLLQVDAFMRVPNKHGRKSRKGVSLFYVIFSSALILFLFSILFSCTVFPVAGEGEKLSLILIDGEEIYVQSGDYYTLLQGYQLYVKGANSEVSRVWIELRRGNVSLEDAIVGKGETFVYSNNSTEILNLTVDTIYGGANGVLVKFSPVYQYLDPRLPAPQTSVTSPDNSSENNSSFPPSSENQAEGFNTPIFLLSIGAVFIMTFVFAGVYKKK
jgi:hypothetical protein